MSTNRDKVRAVYPYAYAERFKTNGHKGYTIIWAKQIRRQRLGSGKTAAEAWKCAREVGVDAATVET